MHRIIKQVAAALALVPLFVLSGCSGGAPVYMAGVETEQLSADKASDDVQENTGADGSERSLEETGVALDVSASVAEQDGYGSASAAGQDSYNIASGEDSQADEGYVYVCGAVVSPGVYPVRSGMRVFEAIALAGGFSQDADEQWLNQARTVEDGQRLYVYSKEETQQMKQDGMTGDSNDVIPQAADEGMAGSLSDSDNPAFAGADGVRININTADRDTLMTLPGIGEAKADAVIQYRTEHGRFASIEEIQNISGIKTAVFSKIRDLITV